MRFGLQPTIGKVGRYEDDLPLVEEGPKVRLLAAKPAHGLMTTDTAVKRNTQGYRVTLDSYKLVNNNASSRRIVHRSDSKDSLTVDLNY